MSTSTTSLLNAASGVQVFRFNSQLDFLFTLSNGVSAPSFSTTLAATGTPQPAPLPGTFVALAAGATLDLGTREETNSTTVTGPLAAFTGGAGDTFDFGCTTFTSSTFSGGGGNIQNNQSTTANCKAWVTYDFTPTPTTGVPEPTALWLLGVGLLGLVGARKQFC